MPGQQPTIGRRTLLAGSAGIVAAAVVTDAVAAEPAAAGETTRALQSTMESTATTARTQWAQYTGPAFVDTYSTNTVENLTPESNAAVRVLSGFQDLWRTGSAWDNGTVLDEDVLEANLEYSEQVTAARTSAESKQAYIFDRQHQSHSALGGLGPLEALYKTGAKAVTAITGAPDGIPADKISDALPPDAPAGSAIGPGSTDSDLGKVALLVNTVRGNNTSSNPSKLAYQYPRPWRMNRDSEVVETGGIPVLGVPAYDSEVAAAPELLRQRSTTPAEDGGFPSGHTNAAWLAGLALAYAVPERFQELLMRASDTSHSRIMAGMHSAVDVVGGRILGTALAAAVLHHPATAQIKADARAQALAYFTEKTGVSVDELHAYAHREAADTDEYADREANRARFAERLTYVLERSGRDAAFTVPKGAEVLLETRLPYLDGEQRRQVLASTALPAGYPILDGPEQWGRLDLFTAADGYGRFDGDLRVVMDAALGGFHAADTWRNDITGSGKLHKAGTGALTLTGDNGFTGEAYIEAGTLRAASATALGEGPVRVKGGTLAIDAHVQVGGDFTQSGAVLDVVVDDSDEAPLAVSGDLDLETGSVLRLRLDPQRPPAAGLSIPLIKAKRCKGTFAEVELDLPGYTATVQYEKKRVIVRIDAA